MAFWSVVRGTGVEGKLGGETGTFVSEETRDPSARFVVGTALSAVDFPLNAQN
jgi:hypothetical protein